MRRERLQCKHLRMFGRVENPCHKILCEIIAEDAVEKDGEYTVTNLQEIRIKCFSADCRKVTVIKTKRKEIEK